MCVSAFFSKNFPPVHKNPPLRRFRSRKEAGTLGELVVDKALCARAVELLDEMMRTRDFKPRRERIPGRPVPGDSCRDWREE